MKKQVVWFASLLLAFSLLLTACAKQEILGEDPVKTRYASATSLYYVETLQDLPDQLFIDVVVVATATTPDEYTLVSEGEVLENVGPIASIDLRNYGAQMYYEVEEVIKGDPALEGTTIEVIETLYWVDGELNTPFCIGENADRVVLCLRDSQLVENRYINPIAEYFLMPILDDGTLEIWPYINRTREKVTLDDFKAMFE